MARLHLDPPKGSAARRKGGSCPWSERSFWTAALVRWTSLRADSEHSGLAGGREGMMRGHGEGEGGCLVAPVVEL